MHRSRPIRILIGTGRHLSEIGQNSVQKKTTTFFLFFFRGIVVKPNTAFYRYFWHCCTQLKSNLHVLIQALTTFVRKGLASTSGNAVFLRERHFHHTQYMKHKSRVVGADQLSKTFNKSVKEQEMQQRLFRPTKNLDKRILSVFSWSAPPTPNLCVIRRMKKFNFKQE